MQPNYGGPVTDPLRRSVDEETIVIDSGLKNKMNDVHAARGDINGVFDIRNVKGSGASYYNIHIYAHDIANQDAYDLLQEAHNDPLSTKQKADFNEHLTGYARVIKFLPSGTKPDGKTIDPNLPDNNNPQSIFEGYWEKGGMSEDAHYGRYYKNGECRIGYFSFEQSNESYRFLGKGLRYKSDGELVTGSEGLYKVDIADTPFTQKTIEDFRENEIPE